MARTRGVIEGVNAFYDGDLGWLQPSVGVAPAVQRKIIVFFSDGFARLQGKEILIQRVMVEARGLIEIESPAFFEGKLRMVEIIRVLAEQHRWLIDAAGQFPRERGFAAATSAAYADGQHIRSTFPSSTGCASLLAAA